MSQRSQFSQLRSAAPVVLPALLFCDFGHLAGEVQKLEAAGARALHLDVMDGHFVPNITYGVPILEAVRRATQLPLDIHMMISEPARYVDQLRAAGADNMTFHIEAVDNPRPLLQQIRSLGASVGVALNPETPLSAIEGCLDACDLVLVMSVSPGFGGQKFEPVALEKLEHLRQRVGPDVLLAVDGGVNEATIGKCSAAGADLFVAGSAVFKTPDYAQSIPALQRVAGSFRRTQE
jgi:ribulose-phosphate 3-epimerase